MDKRSTFTIQSIERAAAVMRSFTEFEPELGVTELSRRLKLHKSTVSRILSTLQKEGFVGQNTVTGKYRLGVGLISLAGVALGRVDVRSAAYSHLDDLVQHTQESASVSVLDGSESVIVLNKASPKPVRYVNWIGRRLPLHCSSSGKVLLAAMSPEIRATILPRSLRRYTDSTIVSVPVLIEELEKVADQGYSIAFEEYEQGYSAVAAPIRNHDGHVVGALSISGPSFRLPQTTLMEFTGAFAIRRRGSRPKWVTKRISTNEAALTDVRVHPLLEKAMTLVQLTPTDVVADRPFTDLGYTTQDSQAIRFMVVCVGLVLGQLSEQERAGGTILFHQPSSENWIHRVVITQPERLLVQTPLITVGFFGIKSAYANVPLAQQLDRQLIPELSNHDDLLAYATICLPTGNFANLVLFASADGKESWGKSTKHAEAIRLLTPDYYAAVRLYNGELPDGIAAPDALRLALVKYYDYGSQPLWRAERNLNHGERA